MIDETAAVRFPVGKRFGQWVILKKIDEGGFGQVYKVENMITKKVAALKAESNDIEGGSALKLEVAIRVEHMTVMRTITADGEKPHVPTVFHAAKHRRFCYMIMTLLGENLKELKLNCPKEYMTAKTWSRIAIQCLYSVKLVHDYGFVHRDIKPNNFVMGYREDYERARLVHILDFGLSRSYAIRMSDGKWVARRARGTAEFRGTLRYCSPNVHEKKEQGRRDDLWSLYYVFIELHCGLPWQTLRDKQKVEMLKMHMSDKDLVLNFPVELHGIVPYLRTLDYYQRPDYTMFYEGLVAVMKRVGAKASDPYDWENPETVKNIQKHLKGPYAWENAADFFKSDPVKVNCAPPPKASKKRRQELKFMLEHSENKELSDHTTASTDVDKKEVTSELTMTDVDKRLAVFGVMRKSSTLGMLKEQVVKKKAVAVSKTPGDARKQKSDTAEDLMRKERVERKEGGKPKEREEKKKVQDVRERIEKRVPKPGEKESKQEVVVAKGKVGEKLTKPKKEDGDEKRKTIDSREKIKPEEMAKENEEKKKTVDSKEKVEKVGGKPETIPSKQDSKEAEGKRKEDEKKIVPIVPSKEKSEKEVEKKKQEEKRTFPSAEKEMGEKEEGKKKEEDKKKSATSKEGIEKEDEKPNPERMKTFASKQKEEKEEGKQVSKEDTKGLLASKDMIKNEEGKLKDDDKMKDIASKQKAASEEEKPKEKGKVVLKSQEDKLSKEKGNLESKEKSENPFGEKKTPNSKDILGKENVAKAKEPKSFEPEGKNKSRENGMQKPSQSKEPSNAVPST